MKLLYKDYFSKVYGCWLGKCISGNIGAPYEGMKQYLELEYSPKFLEEILPNDDLDLQVLWLEVIEEKGANFTTDDLAKIFESNCDYAPGEYAFFKKNHRRGIPAPYAGTFNNEYYKDGMGAPIRSEIWACVAPCNPKLAAEFAYRDAIIDHAPDSESVNGEMFFAALESLAFCESNPVTLVKEAQKFVKKESKFYQMISDVLLWCETDKEMLAIRKKLIRKYGSVEATDCLQNSGFIIAALVLFANDYIKATMEAVNCGFDTDCTGATLGSILGILMGAEKVMAECNITEMTFNLGVRSKKTSNKVIDLAIDVAKMGVSFAGEINKNVEIALAPFEKKVFEKENQPFDFSVDYCGEPSISFGEKKTCLLKIKNLTKKACKLEVGVSTDLPLKAECCSEIVVKGKKEIIVPVTVWVSEEAFILPNGNKVTVKIKANGIEEEYSFGLAGAKRWLIYGPYWKNVVEVPKLKVGESYWNYLNGKDQQEIMDKVRHYHMNSLPDERVDVNGLNECDKDVVDIAIDEVRLDEVTGFYGQATYVLKTGFYSNEEKKIGGIQIGYSDTFKFYLNGKLLAEREGANMYTPENVHIFDVDVKEGVNEITAVLVKRIKGTKFSYNLMTAGVTSDHILETHVNLLKK